MSTQINVTVGQQPLLGKSTQQTQANRQGFLDRQRQAKTGEEAKRQRDANRAKQGIGPDGKPLYGQPLQTTARKDEPAAFRYNKDIVHFYRRPISGGWELMSGNGDRKVQLVLPEPLAQPEYDVLTSDEPSVPTAAATSSLLYGFLNDTVDTGDFYRDGDYVLYDRVETLKNYEKIRIGLYRLFNRHVSLPLGDGTALVILMQDSGHASYTRSYFWHKVVHEWTIALPSPPAPIPGLLASYYEDFFVSQYHSTALENNWVYQTDWVAARIGYNVAELVQVSQETKDAILRLNARADQPATHSEAGITCKYRSTQYIPDGDYSDRCFDYPGFYGFANPSVPWTPTSWQNPGPELQLVVESPIPAEYSQLNTGMPDSYYYGFVSEGDLGFSCTPLQWFSLESRIIAESIDAALTHEELRETVLADDTSVGDLFAAKSLIGLPSELFGSGSFLKGVTKAWAAELPTGNLDDGYPSLDSVNWKNGIKVKSAVSIVNEEPEEWQRCFINDWGQPAFCRQQAIKYKAL